MTAPALAVLRATPVRLAELAAGADPEALRAAPAPGEWSALEVLAHLRACADVWGGCVARLLEEEHPTIRAVNPTAWNADYGDDFRVSLQAFTAQREELLAVLEALPPQDWARSGTVTGAGRPAERTVLSYVERMARHERGHLRQVAALLR